MRQFGCAEVAALLAWDWGVVGVAGHLCVVAA